MKNDYRYRNFLDLSWNLVGRNKKTKEFQIIRRYEDKYETKRKKRKPKKVQKS